MKADGQKVFGILKVGSRNLFYHDSRGSVKELKPLCVLDFYVHESVQRLGIGKVSLESQGIMS
jgi:alpha-tubulin N-acetyltransferase 1